MYNLSKGTPKSNSIFRQVCNTNMFISAQYPKILAARKLLSILLSKFYAFDDIQETTVQMTSE